MKISISILFIINVLFSCKNDNKTVSTEKDNIEIIELDDIQNLSIKSYIENNIKKLIEPKISLCKDCNPKMFRNDTLRGITKFNENMIYYNKVVKISDYLIDAYRIDFKEKKSKGEIKIEKTIIYHWKFSNQKSRQKFIDHIEFYNRALGKYKEESKVIMYKEEIIQNQDYRL